MENGKWKIRNMNLARRLEKSTSFWFVFITSVTFFILRIPSFIEPHWYGDEGIYQTIGLALSQGRLLYTQIWDNKPPLLYAIYAIFRGDQFSVRLFSTLFGIVTVLVYFLLCQKLFDKMKPRIIATGLLALFYATPALEGNIANAENFMLLPIIAAGLITYSLYSPKTHIYESGIRSSTSSDPEFIERNQESGKKEGHIRSSLFCAGLLLGIAFLFKTVALFDLTAFLLYLFVVHFSQKILWPIPWKHLFSLFHDSLFMILGFSLPFLVAILYFTSLHTLADFLNAVFFSNVDYVSYNNNLLFPQGLLALKLLLLGGFVTIIIWQRKKLTNSERFVCLWFLFTTFNVFFSQRPYTHYLLLLLPSYCLLIGVLLKKMAILKKISLYTAVAAVMLLIAINFNIKPLGIALIYYPNVLLFLSGNESTASYWAFFDPKVSRDYEIASYINTHVQKTDTIFVWGDNAQIYALTGKLPPGRYTVAYHIKQNQAALQETQFALSQAKPKYIITLAETTAIPFSLPGYDATLSMKGGTIYERAF